MKTLTHRDLIYMLKDEDGMYRPEYLAAMSFIRNLQWRDFYALWTQDIEKDTVGIVLPLEKYEEFGKAIKEAFYGGVGLDWVIVYNEE